MKLNHIIQLIIAVSSLYAMSESQTDWSGGPDIQGPSSSFGNCFLAESFADYLSVLGTVYISTVLNHLIPGYAGEPEGIATGDIDQDGDIDILRIDDDVYWLENADGAGGSWVEHHIPGPQAYCRSFLRDVDDDGDLDLINQTVANTFAWFENNGVGSGWTEHTVSSTTAFRFPRAFDTGDIDGDGDTDILAGSTELFYAANGVSWFTELSGGSWWRYQIDPYGCILCVAADDMDKDGDADAVASRMGGQIRWYENVQGTGIEWTMHECGSVTYPGMFCLADFDGDTYPDIASLDYYNGTVIWLENPGESVSSPWETHIIQEDFPSDHRFSISSADLNGDGFPDIVAGGNTVRWWSNDLGTGAQWTAHHIAGSFDIVPEVSPADIDGNGEIDVCIGTIPQNEFHWIELFSQNTLSTLESSILDGGNSADWYQLDWTAEEPAGSRAGFQARSEDTVEGLLASPWSDTLWQPGSLTELLPLNHRYFQYRMILDASPLFQSPGLEEVTVFWNPEGAGDEIQAVGGHGLLLPMCNPVSNDQAIGIYLGEPGKFSAMVYGVDGRVAFEYSAAALEAGYHSITLGSLPSGIYLLKAAAGDISETVRFTLLR